MNQHRTVRAVVLALLLSAAGSVAEGQDPLYTYSIPDLVAPTGSTITAEVRLDFPQGVGLEGLSFGICSDPLVAIPTVLERGPAVSALNNGLGPDWTDLFLQANGVGYGVIVDFLGNEQLQPGNDLVIAFVDYFVVGATLGSVTPLEFCETLGAPIIHNIVAIDGMTIDATVISGSLEVGIPVVATFSLDAPDLGIPNDTVHTRIAIENVEPVSGFRFGVDYDESQLFLSSILPTGVLAATNGGAGPDFFSVALGLPGGSGATVACTISTAAPFETIAPGPERAILDLSFFVDGAAGPPCSLASVAFTGSLGSPPVPIEVTVAAGQEPAGTIDGGITIGVEPAALPSGGITLAADQVIAATGEPVTARVRLDNDVAIEAFSFGIAYDPTDVTLETVSAGSRLAQLRCGIGPEFFAAQIHGGRSPGVTVGCFCGLPDPLIDATITPGSEQELVSLGFSTNATPSVGGTALGFTESLGNPAISVEVTVLGQAVSPVTIAGSIAFGVGFARGDCNADGGNDIADAIFLLGKLFPGQGGLGPILCQDACDANDDGLLNVADPVRLLDAIFGASPTPLPPPLGACGSDPTTANDGLQCGQFPNCP